MIEKQPDTVEVSVEEIQREIDRHGTLEESVQHGNEERAWIAGSARGFLQRIISGE